MAISVSLPESTFSWHLTSPFKYGYEFPVYYMSREKNTYNQHWGLGPFIESKTGVYMDLALVLPTYNYKTMIEYIQIK